MHIVGITGSIGSGKTTFARFLADNAEKSRHFESWLVIAEVANAWRAQTKKHPQSDDLQAINDWLRLLAPIGAKICRVPVKYEQLAVSEAVLRDDPPRYAKLLEYLELVHQRPGLQQGEITEESKEMFRSLLQWLGGYFEKHVQSGVWYDEIIRRVQSTKNIELATVGGVRFPADARRISQAGGVVIQIDRPSIVTKDASEVTERDRSLIVPDATIINDAGLPELRSVAALVWRNITQDQLLTEYSAAAVQA